MAVPLEKLISRLAGAVIGESALYGTPAGEAAGAASGLIARGCKAATRNALGNGVNEAQKGRLSELLHAA